MDDGSSTDGANDGGDSDTNNGPVQDQNWVSTMSKLLNKEAMCFMVKACTLTKPPNCKDSQEQMVAQLDIHLLPLQNIETYNAKC